MEKIDLGKPSTALNSKMNRKDLYIDTKNADKHKKELVKNINSLNKILENIGANLEKLNQKNAFDGEYKTLSLQCARKCSSQAQAANSLYNNIETKYTDDLRDIIIKSLDERISYLEDVFLSNK